MFWFGCDCCIALAILDVPNKPCKVKVCVCIADVYSSEEPFVWRLVWTVMPVCPWRCHLKYSLPLRSWHTRCLTCQPLKIHISITKSYSAECEKLLAGKKPNVCSVVIFILVMQNNSVYSQVTSLASSSGAKMSCPLCISSNRMHQEVELW